MRSLLFNLKKILNRKDWNNFFLLIGLSLLFAIIEVLGIASIMPLVGLAMDLDLLETNANYNYWFSLVGIESKIDFFVLFGMLILIYFSFRAVFSIFYIKTLSKFIYGMYYKITVKLFMKYLDLSYGDFSRLNSSNMTKVLITEAYNLAGVLQLLLSICAEVIVLILIYSILLYVNVSVTLFITIVLICISLVLALTVSRKIKTMGIKRVDLNSKMYESINKSLHNYKVVKLIPVDSFIKDFQGSCNKFKDVLISNVCLQAMPRILLEFISFSILILLVLYIFYSSYPNTSTAMGTISAFVLGLYRMMPSINKIISGYNQLLFNLKSIDVVTNQMQLDSEELGNCKVDFSRKIILENVSFSYDDEVVLRNVNLTINKGDKIAFVGESGCGKSTLVDILMGLHEIKNGSFFIDKQLINSSNVRDWRTKIGYIPQDIYLFDGSVADNVVFGRAYDESKIVSSLKKAKIYDHLAHIGGIGTEVGENGALLSGGQKQRIAIARALYDDPEILILDEATSALDIETESKIMDEIHSIEGIFTLIVITHRAHTLEKCDFVYRIKNKSVTERYE